MIADEGEWLGGGLRVTDVFISYARYDRVAAAALAEDLRKWGVEVWWDDDLYGGDDFHDAIRSAIDASKATIVIWSTAAVASRWVRGEADYADSLGKLIPLHVPGFDVS